MTAPLADHPEAPEQGFTRGFLLAAAWAGSAARPRAALRVRPMEEEPSPAFAAELLAADGENRSRLAARWCEEEPIRRADQVLDLHWTWLPPELERETPQLLVLFLNSIRPDLARDTLRAFWPRLRNLPSEELELLPFPPAVAAMLRRRVFEQLVIGPDPAGEGFEIVLRLERRELHLLLQATGFREIALAGGANARADLAARLAAHRGDDAARLARLFEKGDPAGCAPERAALAAAHLDAGLVASGDQGDLLEFVGLNRLAGALSTEPRDAGRRLAQRMQRPTGERLLAWRDAWATSGFPDPGGAREELMREARTVLARFAVPSVQNRVWV